jgi:hypothetical protein
MHYSSIKVEMCRCAAAQMLHCLRILLVVCYGFDCYEFFIVEVVSLLFLGVVLVLFKLYLVVVFV